jgi:hypothetical protein
MSHERLPKKKLTCRQFFCWTIPPFLSLLSLWIILFGVFGEKITTQGMLVHKYVNERIPFVYPDWESRGESSVLLLILPGRNHLILLTDEDTTLDLSFSSEKVYKTFAIGADYRFE